VTAAQAADAIALFEKSTGWKDFSTLHEEQALKFRRDLECLRNNKWSASRKVVQYLS